MFGWLVFIGCKHMRSMGIVEVLLEWHRLHKMNAYVRSLLCCSYAKANVLAINSILCVGLLIGNRSENDLSRISH